MAVAAGRHVVPKHRAFTTLCALFAVAAGALLWGPVALVFGFFAGGADRIHRVHIVGWGIGMGLLVTLPLFVELFHPERKIAGLQQTLVALAALGVGAAIATSWELLGFIAALALGAVILASIHPARNELLHGSGEHSPTLRALTVVGAVPMVWYAVNAASLQRNGSALDPHVKGEHWAIMAGVGLGIVAVAALASARTHGWRLPAWSASLGMIALGLVSILNQDRAGSLGRARGAVAVAAGVLFLAAAEREARADRRDAREEELGALGV